MAEIYKQAYQVSLGFGADYYLEPPITWKGRYYEHFHRGIDLVAAAGAPVYAAQPGIVYAAGTDRDGAIYVIERADSGHWMLYWHLSKVLVKSGQRIDNSTQIGNQGSTGNSTGQHTHFEVDEPQDWPGGTLKLTPVDPMPFLQGKPPRGETEDMTTEDYLSDIFDVIADDPWYAETKPDVFKNHVAYVKSLDWAGRRAWFKQVLTDNGVLAKTRMADHLADDKAYQQRAESEMNSLSQQVIDSTVKLESATEEQQRTLAGKDAEIKDLTTQLDKALQNAKDVSRWTWREHLAAAFSLFFGKGGGEA